MQSQAKKKAGEVKQIDDLIPDNEDLMKKGVYIMKDGSRYDGTVLEGDHGILVRHGSGTFTDTNVSYIGSWSKDKMHGKGKLTFSDGSSYEGDFKDNSFDGIGKYQWADGAYYLGEWKENRIQGSGNFIQSSGETWTGMFDCGTSKNLELIYQ